MSDFDEVVGWAGEFLTGIMDLPDEADKLCALTMHFIDNGDVKSLEALIAASNRQALSFEAMCRAVAKCLRQGISMPAQLSEWAAQTILDPDTRPKRPKKFLRMWPGEETERNIMIYEAVCALQSLGVLPTRNADSFRICGCEAVAQALRLAGSPVTSYKMVLEIYADIKRRIENGRDPRVGVSVINDLINSAK